MNASTEPGTGSRPWVRSDAHAWSASAFAGDVLRRLTALTLLGLLSPVLIGVALAIAVTDGAPVTFGHYRVGQDGRLFRCLKFRTMRRDAEDALARLLREDPAALESWRREQKLAVDPRVTRLGRFLRRSSLDELPQLINVLMGDMAFVGPRPITVEELPRYGRDRWHYLSVRPGVTGLWQVNGRNTTTYEARVALDRHYVENRSLWLDATILWKTVSVVLTQKGAS